MTREEFATLVGSRPVILDGATGTNLQKAGMPVGVCPEQWILENPGVLIELQERYVEAGTDILFAPTFTASRIKLEEYGLEDSLVQMNRELVALSKRAAGGRAYVAGDLTMTGRQLYPLGDLMFEDLVEVYKEQAKVICEAGADLFVVETMMSLQECRAAVIAIREVCDLPIMVSLTYNEDGRTLYGTDPATAVIVLQSLGADAVGLNCSTGPEAMIDPVQQMAEYATIPLLAKPNAGMPELCGRRDRIPYHAGGVCVSRREACGGGRGDHRRMLRHDTGAYLRIKAGGGFHAGAYASHKEKTYARLGADACGDPA